METRKVGAIITGVAIIDKNGRVIYECDTIAEAKKWNRQFGSPMNDIQYWAAETINADGDLNPAVYADTRKEARDKLKQILL